MTIVEEFFQTFGITETVENPDGTKQEILKVNIEPEMLEMFIKLKSISLPSKWEYKVVFINNLLESQKTVWDGYGSEGWELVTIYKSRAIFKRPLVK